MGAEMFLESNNASGRFDVRNYGARRIMSSVDDTEDLQDVNAETTESNERERERERERFAEMFLEDNNASGRFDVRNYGARRMMSSVDDTEDLQDVNAETTESNEGEVSDEPPSKFISRQTSRELEPLPDGWEEKIMPDGKIFFVNHNKAETTWEDPRFALSHDNSKCPEYSSKYRNKYRRFLQRIHVSTEGKLELNVRRDYLVEDSLHQISKITQTEKLKKSLWIEFMGERAEDFGGVARDWFFNLSTELFNPYYGLFEYSANDVY